MAERLLSVGLDVGTTSTQIVFSALCVENQAGAFAVPELTITERRVLYQSPVHFTPLIRGELVDAAALRRIVDREYKKAGIRRDEIDTGAIIITGETSRKENASAVLAELSGYAGEFVVAAAGPALESALAARGAGMVRESAQSGETIVHIDIGGGTSNFALIRAGQITATGCYNVGGRLVKFGEDGVVTYVSPVLSGVTSLKVGDRAEYEALFALARTLAQILEMAAGLRKRTPLLDTFLTRGAEPFALPEGERAIISFSGGVADCIAEDMPWTAFGDIGVCLGKAIRESRLCEGNYLLGKQTIRATVIGAGCHSTQLSGSTVYHRNVAFPLKNLRVICMERPDATSIATALKNGDGDAVLALRGLPSAEYAEVRAYAEQIVRGFAGRAIRVCLEQDMAKALGQALALVADASQSILCIDRVRLTAESYLDVAAPIGAALPVVVKTLILERQEGDHAGK